MAVRARTTSSRTPTVFHAVRRKRRVRKKVLTGGNGIAPSPDGPDGGGVEPTVELRPQAVDVDLDDVGGALPVGAPEVFVEHLARDHLAAVTHQELQQAELRGGQVNLLAAPRDPLGGQVQAQVAC